MAAGALWVMADDDPASVVAVSHLRASLALKTQFFSQTLTQFNGSQLLNVLRSALELIHIEHSYRLINGR